MAATDDDRVELTELDVIARYSLAVRHPTASRDELIATLRDDLAWLESTRAGRRRTTSRSTPATPAGKATPRTRSR